MHATPEQALLNPNFAPAIRNFCLFYIAAVILFSGILCGCSGNKKPVQDIRYYTLSYETPALASLPRLPVTLSMGSIKTAAPFQSRRIVYATDNFTRNTYYYHQWMSPPEKMLAALLLRDFRDSGYFRAVLPENHMAADVQVDGVIEAFYEKDGPEQWQAVLSVTITLINPNNRHNIDRNDKDTKTAAERVCKAEICFQKTYDTAMTLSHKHPKSLAKAMSQAAAALSRQIIEDVYTALAPHHITK